ncbi:MAG: imidazole glycerol phosphate synthase subunit HisH, partial [Metallosphaera sp.]
MKALVLNYGVGNLFSISSALRRTGFEVEIATEPKEVDLIVLPGVGSFSAVASFISRWKRELNDFRRRGVKFLGVCLGMQIMFEEGSEGGRSQGLGWFSGYVDLIKGAEKLPHVGWDVVEESKPCILTEQLDKKYVYFVHSYVAYTDFQAAMISRYGLEFPALICNDQIAGTQFHPEKSG